MNWASTIFHSVSLGGVRDITLKIYELPLFSITRSTTPGTVGIVAAAWAASGNDPIPGKLPLARVKSPVVLT